MLLLAATPCASPISAEISKAHLRKGGCRDGERNQYHDDSCQLSKAISYFLHLYSSPFGNGSFFNPTKMLCNDYASEDERD
jgi:hypothetical protein